MAAGAGGACSRDEERGEDGCPPFGVRPIGESERDETPITGVVGLGGSLAEFVLDDLQLYMGTSIGIAIASNGDLAAGDLLRGHGAASEDAHLFDWAFDEVDAENGAMQIIPGSHRLLIGDYQKRIKAELLRTGALTDEEIRRAVTLSLRPGEFYIFHSWLLHTSGPNQSNRRRAGLNMRYAAQGEECDTQFEYFPLLCSAGPHTPQATRAAR